MTCRAPARNERAQWSELSAPRSVTAELPHPAIGRRARTLSLEQVYGAITFYLGNKEEVETDMAERKREEDEYTKTHPNPPDIKEKFACMRQQMLSRQS